MHYFDDGFLVIWFFSFGCRSRLRYPRERALNQIMLFRPVTWLSATYSTFWFIAHLQKWMHIQLLSDASLRSNASRAITVLSSERRGPRKAVLVSERILKKLGSSSRFMHNCIKHSTRLARITHSETLVHIIQRVGVTTPELKCHFTGDHYF